MNKSKNVQIQGSESEMQHFRLMETVHGQYFDECISNRIG